MARPFRDFISGRGVPVYPNCHIVLDHSAKSGNAEPTACAGRCPMPIRIRRGGVETAAVTLRLAVQLNVRCSRDSPIRVPETLLLTANRVLPEWPIAWLVGGRLSACRIEQMRESPSAADRIGFEGS